MDTGHLPENKGTVTSSWWLCQNPSEWGFEWGFVVLSRSILLFVLMYGQAQVQYQNECAVVIITYDNRSSVLKQLACNITEVTTFFQQPFRILMPSAEPHSGNT